VWQHWSSGATLKREARRMIKLLFLSIYFIIVFLLLWNCHSHHLNSAQYPSRCMHETWKHECDIFINTHKIYYSVCKKHRDLADSVVCVIIVTYSGFSIHDGTLLHSESQYTTVKHSQQLFKHTYTSDPHGLGTPTPIEFFQQDLLWRSSNTHSHSYSQKASKQTRSIRRRAIGPLAHHNGTSAHRPSLACHLPAPTIGCLHHPLYRLTCFSHCFPDTTAPDRSPDPTQVYSKSRIHRNICILLPA
jgi:hypothetical protein